MTMAKSYTGTMPTTGAEVYTSDGDKLGKVKEVSGDCFKVDALMQPDYWLARDTITTAGGNDVRLSFDKKMLSDMKLAKPSDMPATGTHTGVHRHTETVL